MMTHFACQDNLPDSRNRRGNPSKDAKKRLNKRELNVRDSKITDRMLQRSQMQIAPTTQKENNLLDKKERAKTERKNRRFMKRENLIQLKEKNRLFCLEDSENTLNNRNKSTKRVVFKRIK